MTEPPPLPLAGTNRYAPQRAFPPYRYVPGRHPHPTAHEGGHSRHRPQETAEAPDDSTWRTNEPYRHACDLLNHGYFWEAHEGWEDLWRRTPRHRVADRLVLQGLVQVAAAHLKQHVGAEEGARRLARRATEKLRSAGAGNRPVRLGVAVEPFSAAVEGWFSGATDAWPVLRLAEE